METMDARRFQSLVRGFDIPSSAGYENFSPARRYGISCDGGARVGGDDFDDIWSYCFLSIKSSCVGVVCSTIGECSFVTVVVVEMPVVETAKKIGLVFGDGSLSEGLKGFCMAEDEQFMLCGPIVAPIAPLRMVKPGVTRRKTLFCFFGLSLCTRWWSCTAITVIFSIYVCLCIDHCWCLFLRSCWPLFFRHLLALILRSLLVSVFRPLLIFLCIVLLVSLI